MAALHQRNELECWLQNSKELHLSRDVAREVWEHIKHNIATMPSAQLCAFTAQLCASINGVSFGKASQHLGSYNAIPASGELSKEETMREPRTDEWAIKRNPV